MKLTAKKLSGLQWIFDHEPVGLFDAKAPTRRMVQILEEEKFIERVPKSAAFSLVKYATTEAGRSALSQNEGDRK